MKIVYEFGYDVLACPLRPDAQEQADQWAFIACNKATEETFVSNRKISQTDVGKDSRILRTVFGLTIYGTRTELIPILQGLGLNIAYGHL